MDNRDVQAARHYHDLTKHSYWSVRSNAHALDWANRPSPFKIYRHLDTIPLEMNWPLSGASTGDALLVPALPGGTECVPDLKVIASLLYHASGITRRRQYAGGDVLFRAAACTGALYEIDLHVVCGPLPGLAAGVYHFDPRDFVLRRLREGDYRGILGEATGQDLATAGAAAVIVCTGTYWRNAWKYQARTYRHFGWDNGTLLANLLAMAAAYHLPARVVSGFADDPVNRLLALDTDREVSLHLVPVGRMAPPAAAVRDIPPLSLETEPYSTFEVEYPEMREIHAASSLDLSAVAAWRGNPTEPTFRETTGQSFNLEPSIERAALAEGIESVIVRRGSTRRFARESITFPQLSTILSAATDGIAADFLGSAGGRLNDLYVITHAVDGLPPGSYVLRRDRPVLELLQTGNFRSQAGYLGLEQELPADASAAVFFLADLNPILERFGNRGYRAVQLEAGILGGKMYLAAYAQRLGASGLTFYDDEVVRFFSPHAEGKSAIFLLALGRRRPA